MSQHQDGAFVIAYDISDRHRRTQLHRLLRGFGNPIQKSVFICHLDGRRRHRLQKLLNGFQNQEQPGKEVITFLKIQDSSEHYQNTTWVIE